MSPLRAAICFIAGLFLVAALALACAGFGWAALNLGFLPLLILFGLAVERWRYKPLAERRPPGPGWVATDERFVDPETGKLVTVYYLPATGERRYVTG